jgi:hypothetical protein
MADEVVEDGRVEDAGGGEFLASDGGANDGEDAGADDGSDAERGEADGAEGFLERVFGQLALGDELVYAFPGEYLLAQNRLLR